VCGGLVHFNIARSLFAAIDLTQRNPALQRLKKEGKLFHYQKDRTHYWSKDIPEVKPDNFDNVEVGY
jgi:hypothetical protein